jgi:exodeoxyribonuclease-3
MKIMSRNVNGIRAVLGKLDLTKLVESLNIDILCLQEVKAEKEQVNFYISGYDAYRNSAKTKKGYSGVAIYTRIKPISVAYGIGKEEHDQEGRVITLEFPDYYLITVYTPNSKEHLARLPYRMVWEDEFLSYLKKLEEKKPIVFCGDLNVAHEEIDLKNPKENVGNAGFSPEERQKFTHLLDNGFIDTFRYLYPNKTEYSRWSYRMRARERNIGWRIDYFVISKPLLDRLVDSEILGDIQGSDHCPVLLTLK